MAEAGTYRAKIGYRREYPYKKNNAMLETIYSNEFKIGERIEENEKVFSYAKDIYGEDIKFIDIKKYRAIEMIEVGVIYNESSTKTITKRLRTWLFLLPLEQDPYNFYYVGYGGNKGINFENISGEDFGLLMNLSERREEPKEGKALTYIIFNSRGQNPQWDFTTYMYNPIGDISGYNFELTKPINGTGGHDREFSIYVNEKGDIIHHQVTAVLFC